MINNFVLIINRLYETDGSKITIGGIQTYLKELCKVINKNYNRTPIIYQYADVDFRKDEGDYIVVGIKTAKKSVRKRINNVFNFVRDEYEGQDTLLIWGSDQYSLKSNKFNSINIQHGIAFDTEAIESPIKRLVIELGFLKIYKYFQRLKARQLIKNSKYVVCVDYNFVNWLRTYGSTLSKDISVIPNFTMIPLTTIPDFENRPLNIIIARRFVRRRGIDLAVDALYVLLEKYPSLSVTFAGHGPDVDKIEELERKFKGRVLITSFNAEDSVTFHSNYKYSLIPSIGSEGTSLSLLESMAAKCVPIATNVGGMTNIIIDKYNGLMIEPNANEIINAISELIENDDFSKRLSYFAGETVAYGFSRDLWEKKWTKLINKVISQ